jgi:hypothetical protein
MFAHPTKPGAHRPCFVHDGLNIHANLSFCFGPLLFDPVAEFAEFLADYFVIVIAPGVAGHSAEVAVFIMLMWRVVVHRDDHD